MPFSKRRKTFKFHLSINSKDQLENKTPENDLLALLSTPMPFGKYQGRAIADLPEHYLVWFHSKGFPKGRLGHLLGLMYEIKLNGLEYLLKPLRDNQLPEE